MTFHRVRIAIATTLSLLILRGLALAGKPSGGGGGGGTVPPGIIYFGQYQGNWMSMNGDGSNKRYAPIMNPSSQRHAGSRWSLQGDIVDGPLDPSGNEPIELFATNESGRSIQLTHDPDICCVSYWLSAWSKDDSFVSFAGVMNTPDGLIGGLFVIDLDWSTGVPIATEPMLVFEAEVYRGSYWRWSDVNLYQHDWSPAGDEVVYTAYDSVHVRQLYVASFTGVGVQTSHLTSGTNPAWSPDGSRIAFDRNEIWTIRPDGAGALRLTQASATQGQSSPTWSPDEAYLAFGNASTAKSGKTTSTIQRIAAAGGAATNLTSELTAAYGPHWRQ